MSKERIIIYSMLPRLWGNNTPDPIPSGSMSRNGVGKFEDIKAEDLEYIRSLGCNYVWYIGVLEHATKTRFVEAGIPCDHPDIVKGEAGSPYAIRDYYDVAPSLATDIPNRMHELEALIERSHEAGLKVLIDFVPNHLARTYGSDVAPRGVQDLGINEDSGLSFSTENCFYYLLGTELHLPVDPTSDLAPYTECPARATGNDCFSPYPSRNDWYETVKLNYGIDYLGGGALHADPIPTTWLRMREILNFWASKGVDGFRCDMAEMVPEAFWTWVISSLRQDYPDLVFLAEIYQAHRYASYLEAGFDYLYDKVGLYDTLRSIVRGELSASAFTPARDAVGGMQGQMCYFLENHDEQRFASDFFARSSAAWLPSLGVAVLSGGNPYLHYFAGELGERGMDAEGFSGCDGRTTIFDYWSLDKVRRLRSRGFGDFGLTEEEIRCLENTRLVLGKLAHHPLILEGAYHGLNYCNEANPHYDAHRLLSFVRYQGKEALLVVANFSGEQKSAELILDAELLSTIGLGSNQPLKRTDLCTDATSIITLTPLAPLCLELKSYDLCVWHLKKL